MKGVTREWAITLGFCLLTLLALGLSLTWVNIERVDMAYELKRLQTEIDAQDALISKLEVERNTLMTPERLRVLASQYGLTQARPGQIRRLSAAGDELPSPVIKSVPVPEKPQKKTEAARDGKDSPKAKGKKAKDGADKAKAETKAEDASSKTPSKSRHVPVPYEPEPKDRKKDAPRADAGFPGVRA